MTKDNSNIDNHALAGGAIAVSILETLVEKGILTQLDGRIVLSRARSDLLSAATEESMQASMFIASIINAKFPADR